MTLINTTPVPNDFFSYLPQLTDSEIRVLLLVIRQTCGWKNARTQERKSRDRMTYDYIIKKTGLYRTILSSTIQSLVYLKVLVITDYEGTILDTAEKRKGKHSLFYQFQPVRNFDTTCTELRTTPIRNLEHNKRNTNKKKLIQKENLEKLKDMQNILTIELRKLFD